MMLRETMGFVESDRDMALKGVKDDWGMKSVGGVMERVGAVGGPGFSPAAARLTRSGFSP
jgi:hypothetical protein